MLSAGIPARSVRAKEKESGRDQMETEKRVLGALAALCLGAAALRAQEAPSPSPAQEQGRPTQAELLKRIEQLDESYAAELEELRAEIEALEEEAAAARARAQTPSLQSASVFNPGLTVFGNFLARVDDAAAYVDDDPGAERADDRFSLREVELDLRAPIDPWADGVLIATFEAEVPGEYEASIEEGYVTLKKLPFLDSAPAGLKVKAGRFRPSLGRFNTIHLHDLPQITYPRALRTFLGSEGFLADGLSGQFFLPSPSERDVLDATVQVLDGGNIAVAADQDPSDIATVGRVKWFRDLAPGRDLELGLSSWHSSGSDELWSVDATYRWKPFVAGEWKSFLLGFEGFQADLDDPLAASPSGWDLWSQYQLSRNLYVGARYDWTEELADASLESRTAGVFLTYYTTEFLRFRLGYERTSSDVAELDGLESLFLELNFIFGSHPAEPYWVNR